MILVSLFVASSIRLLECKTIYGYLLHIVAHSILSWPWGIFISLIRGHHNILRMGFIPHLYTLIIFIELTITV
jgi:hypothetical protein